MDTAAPFPSLGTTILDLDLLFFREKNCTFFAGMRIRNFFCGSGSGSADPTLIRNETKIFIYFNKKKYLYILMKKNNNIF